MAEERNPGLTTVLWSQDVNWDLDTLAEAFPSLCAVLGDDVGADLALRIGLSGARSIVAAAQEAASQHPAYPIPQAFVDAPLPSSIELEARTAA